MIFRRRAAASRDAARVPAGERVYAIGDIHGRIDLLDGLLDAIAADQASRPPARTTLVFLGDLINRGSDSAAVVRRIRDLAADGRYAVRTIRGNHEEVFLLAATGDARATRALIDMGGAATIRSFGIDDADASHGTFADLATLLRARLPADDIAFLEAAEDMVEIGDYLFVHAGIRPGVAIGEQEAADLRWIRRAFLDSERDHGRIVVHGHTISERVEERANRIGVDTGAYASGRLSALGLEDDRRWTIDHLGQPAADARTAMPRR